jgi:disulfide bond formation protein DsbB
MIGALNVTPRLVSLAIAGLCLSSLGIALAAQYWGGIQPCVLCVYQRYAYLAALAFGLLGLALAGHRGAHRLTVGLAGLSFLAGAAIAFFHTGVEQKWWRGTDECHAPSLDPSLSIDEMKDLLLNQSFVACDQIPWSLFGLSIAGWNFLAMLLFAGFCCWALARLKESTA